MQGMIEPTTKIHRSVHDKVLLCIYSFALCSVTLLCGIEWLQNICFGDVYVRCELLKRSLSVLNLPCVHLQQSPPASETCRRNTSRPSWSKSVLVASTTSTVLTHLTHYIQNYKHIFINFPKWNTVYCDEGFYPTTRLWWLHMIRGRLKWVFQWPMPMFGGQVNRWPSYNAKPKKSLV